MSRILIIDDNTFVLDSLQMVLEDHGHSVKAVTSGAMGLAELDRTPCDILITDVVMPDKDGIEVLLETQAKHPSLKTIVISGGGRIDASTYLPTAKVLGADHTLAKPFTNLELISCVDSLLA